MAGDNATHNELVDIKVACQPDELPGVGAEALIDNTWERMGIKYNNIIVKG